MLKRLWLRLTAPHPSITDVEQKRQSQLLASMAVFILFFQVLSLPFILSGLYSSGGVASYLMGTMMAISVYIFNARGHYIVAAYLLVIVGFIAIHQSLITSNHAILFYAGLVFITSAIFLSIKTTLALFVLSVTLQGVATIYDPQSYTLSRIDPLLFLIFMVPFILMFMFHRLSVEKERQAELQAAFNALQESEARWRSLVATAPNTLSLVERDYSFSFVNNLPNGIPPEKLVNQQVKDYIHPDYYQSSIECFEKAFVSKSPIRFEAVCIDIYGNEQWYALSANAVRDKETPSQLLVVARNISKKREAELRLIEEHNLLRTLVDSIPDSIYIKDTEGRFILNNRTSMQKLGVKKQEELTGKTDFDIFPLDLATEFRKNEEEALNSSKPFLDYEEPLVDLNNAVVGQVLTSLIPARNTEGQVTHIIGISRNITARKQLERQTLEISIHRERIKVLEDVVSDISHDIKTPLASIKTAVYILQNHPEKREAYLEQLDIQVNRLTKLVEDVLAMARLDKKGYLTFSSMSLTHLNKSVEYIIKDFEARLVEKNIKLSQSLNNSEELIVINETELGELSLI